MNSRYRLPLLILLLTLVVCVVRFRSAPSSVALVAREAVPAIPRPAPVATPPAVPAAADRPAPSAAEKSAEAKAVIREISVQEQVAAAMYWMTPMEPRWGREAGPGGINPAQELSVQFDPRGVLVRPVGAGENPAWTWALEFNGRAAAPESDGKTRLTFARGNGVTEWFENKPEGVEHGFTLGADTVRNEAGEVHLPLVMRTGLVSVLTEDQRSLILRGESGEEALRYENLQVWDARGMVLPARMELADAGAGARELKLIVSARDAVFPVVVDPLITRNNGQLLTSPAEPGGRAGYAVALSGNLAAVAAPGLIGSTTGPAGAVHLYEKKVSGWVLLKTLTPPAGGRSFGLTLALSGPHLAVTWITGNGGDETDVSLYRRDHGGPENWGLVTTLTGPADSLFGMDLDIEDQRMAIMGVNTELEVPQVFLYALNGDSWLLNKLIPVDPAFASGVNSASVSLGKEGRLAMAYSTGVGGRVEIRQQHTGGVDQWGVERTIFAPGGADAFGFSICLSGDLLAVGAPARDSGADNSGGCYVYRQHQGGNNQWGLVASLQPEVPVEAGLYGLSVDLDGSTLVVGAAIGAATGNDTGCFLYQYQPGSAEPFPLVRSFTDAGEGGGLVSLRNHLVAVSVDLVLLGNPTADAPGALADTGRALVLEQLEGTWVRVASPGADFVTAGMMFGSSLAMEGDLLAVGAPGMDNPVLGGNDVGAVFIFTRSDDTWTLQKRLDGGSQSGAGGGFGTAVALCGDMLAVGSSGDGESSPNGAVHLFRQHGDDSYDWDEVRRIVPQGTGLTRGFGLSLALAENWLAVGYPLAGTGGQVRMYARNIGTPDAWSPRGILENPAASEDDLFGRSLSLDGSWLAVGAPSAKGVKLVNFQPAPLDGAGRVYLFEENVGGGSNWGLTVRLPVTVLSNEPFGEANGQFGSSVCLEGTQLAIGAPRENNDRGRIYVHERTIGLGLVTWGQRAVLEVPASLPVDRLGQSVCLQDDMVAGGASWLSPQGLGSPVACLFRRNAGGRNVYGYEGMAAAAEVRRPDLFRNPDTNLAMWGRQLVMGSPGSPFSQTEGGHVDVFLRQDDRWAMTRSAPALVPATNNTIYVPGVVDLDHEHAAVGYWNTPDTPAVFLLERNQGGAGQWGVVKKITETGADADDFGNSLSLSGRHLAVGAAGASLNGLTSNGAVYVYEQNTSGDNNWGLLVRFAGIRSGDVVGSSVALDGRRLLAGAPGYDVNNTIQNAGAVYVYEYSSGADPHWSGTTMITAETPTANEQFGVTVALDGDVAAVGIPSMGAGRIAIHRRNVGGLNAWGRSALVQNPFNGGEEYGYRGVAMSGGWLVAGSVKDAGSTWGVGVTNLASVLDPQPPVFNLSTRRVTFPAGVEEAGAMQDISGGTMVAANISWQDLIGSSIHIFSRNVGGAGAWGLEASINHPNLSAVAISGRTILAAGYTSLRIYELSGSGYDNWTRRHFTDSSVNNPALEASVWGPVADPDKDGLTNLEEAYGGTSPLASQPELIRQAGRDPVTGEFWFRWRQGGDDQGVRALPQWSVDLQNWRGPGSSLGSPNPIAVNVSIRSSATLDDGMEWEARIPALPAQSVFWRLFLWRE